MSVTGTDFLAYGGPSPRRGPISSMKKTLLPLGRLFAQEYGSFSRTPRKVLGKSFPNVSTLYTLIYMLGYYPINLSTKNTKHSKSHNSTSQGYLSNVLDIIGCSTYEQLK